MHNSLPLLNPNYSIANVHPSECRELIARGTPMAINHSGGKDSQCMTILLSRLVPREQLLVVHAPSARSHGPMRKRESRRRLLH